MTSVERVAELPEQWFRKGREQGLEEGREQSADQQRAMLCRITEARFGAETADHLDEVLAPTGDRERFAEVADCLGRCNTAAEFLACLEPAITMRQERWHRFRDAVRRWRPGDGDDESLYETFTMLDGLYESIGEEGWNLLRERFRQTVGHDIMKQGELKGKLLAIESLLGHDVPWSAIESATGIDEPTFRRLKHQLLAAGHDNNPN